MYYAAEYRRLGHPGLALRLYLEVARLQVANGLREPGFGGSRNRFLRSFPLFLASPRLYQRLKRSRDGASRR
jgi:hypothetical protein